MDKLQTIDFIELMKQNMRGLAGIATCLAVVAVGALLMGKNTEGMIMFLAATIFAFAALGMFALGLDRQNSYRKWYGNTYHQMVSLVTIDIHEAMEICKQNRLGLEDTARIVSFAVRLRGILSQQKELASDATITELLYGALLIAENRRDEYGGLSATDIEAIKDALSTASTKIIQQAGIFGLTKRLK